MAELQLRFLFLRKFYLEKDWPKFCPDHSAIRDGFAFVSGSRILVAVLIFQTIFLQLSIECRAADTQAFGYLRHAS